MCFLFQYIFLHVTGCIDRIPVCAFTGDPLHLNLYMNVNVPLKKTDKWPSVVLCHLIWSQIMFNRSLNTFFPAVKCVKWRVVSCSNATQVDHSKIGRLYIKWSKCDQFNWELIGGDEYLQCSSDEESNANQFANLFLRSTGRSSEPTTNTKIKTKTVVGQKRSRTSLICLVVLSSDS